MTQTINFLRALPKTSNRLPLSYIGLILIGLFVLFLIISMLTGVKQYKAHHVLNNSNIALKEAQQTYEKLAIAHPLLVSDTPLANQVKALQEQVLQKKAEYDSLEHRTNRRGFSQYMFALAQVVPTSLWFNQIRINQDTGSVTLRGFAVRSDDVSVLLSRLIDTPVYNKIVFNLFFVKTNKNLPYVKFSIATEDLGSEEDKEDQSKTELKE